MMRGNELIFLVIVAVVVTAALVFDALVEGHGLRVLAFPGVVGIVVLLLCGLRLCHLHGGSHVDNESPQATAALGRVARAAAGFMAVLPVVMVLGLTIGLPAYVAAYVKLKGENWRAAALAALVTLVSVLLFVEFLGMQLPEAPLAWP